MRVLILGGAGFIGTHIAQRLHTHHHVTILDNFTPQVHGTYDDISARKKFLASFTQVQEGDVRDYEVLVPHVCQADAVIHLVAETGVGQSMYDVRRYVSVNDLGSATLMEALVKEKHKVQKLILTSSRAVYGECAYRTEDGQLVVPPARCAEVMAAGKWEPTLADTTTPIMSVPTPITAPPNPTSIYGVTKYNQELICGVLGELINISIGILRLFNVYGEGQSLKNPYTGILTVFANRIEQGLPPLIYEDGFESRDFVHVEDVVSALKFTLENEKLSVGRHVFNVGSGRRSTILELAQIMIEQYGQPLTPEVTGQYRVGDIRHAVADISRTRAMLGYEPQVALEDGIQRFIAWAQTIQRNLDGEDKASAELKRYGLLRKANY